MAHMVHTFAPAAACSLHVGMDDLRTVHNRQALQELLPNATRSRTYPGVKPRCVHCTTPTHVNFSTQGPWLRILCTLHDSCSTNPYASTTTNYVQEQRSTGIFTLRFGREHHHTNLQ